MIRKKILIAVIAALLVGFVGGIGHAKEFPSKTFKFVIPNPPGGGTYAYARGFVQVWKKYLPKGVNAIVKPKPGGGNRLGTNFMWKAKPDGYTLGMVSIPGMVAAQMVQKTVFDLSKMVWLGSMDVGPRLIAISSKLGIKSVEELKKSNKEIVVATGGLTASSGITSILAFDLLGIKWRSINLSGSSESITAVLRGDADAVNFNIPSIMPFIKDGDFIPMFVTGVKERVKELPNVPTLNELGYPVGVYLADVRAFGIRPGVPEERLQFLRRTAGKALNDPEFHAYGRKVKRTTNVLTAKETSKAIQTLFELFSKKKELLRSHVVR